MLINDDGSWVNDPLDFDHATGAVSFGNAPSVTVPEGTANGQPIAYDQLGAFLRDHLNINKSGTKFIRFQDGSGNNEWLIRTTSDGLMHFYRYSPAGTYVDTPLEFDANGTRSFGGHEGSRHRLARRERRPGFPVECARHDRADRRPDHRLTLPSLRRSTGRRCGSPVRACHSLVEADPICGDPVHPGVSFDG